MYIYVSAIQPIKDEHVKRQFVFYKGWPDGEQMLLFRFESFIYCGLSYAVDEIETTSER